MATGPGNPLTLEELDARLRVVLPEEYQDSYDEVQPVSMGSAPLQFAGDGRVAWDQIWGSFCDLAMAGGPPHKGTLLEPGARADIDAQPERYAEVMAEICRGVELVTDLPADPAPDGWVRVECYTETMAQWLLRAIVMENISARAAGKMLDLPAAPSFRLEKEIKNDITVIAKTCHYWLGHMPFPQQRAIAALFTDLAADAPLIEPPHPPDNRRPPDAAALFASAAGRIERDTALRASPHHYAGWLGLQCATVRPAVWMMRALVVCNVLARREGVVLFVPINPVVDPNGDRVVAAVKHVHDLAAQAVS